jgi:hypothetical protein
MHCLAAMCWHPLVGTNQLAFTSWHLGFAIIVLAYILWASIVWHPLFDIHVLAIQHMDATPWMRMSGYQNMDCQHMNVK